VDYHLQDVKDAEPPYRLITTILDPKQGPAKELAVLYHERGEIETALDELKTHLRGAQIVVRSKTSELVEQEFYSLLMAHFAIRGLMHEAVSRPTKPRPAFLPPPGARDPAHGALRCYSPLGRRKPCMTRSWMRFCKNALYRAGIASTHGA
jgi:hypothetical protein